MSFSENQRTTFEDAVGASVKDAFQGPHLAMQERGSWWKRSWQSPGTRKGWGPPVPGRTSRASREATEACCSRDSSMPYCSTTSKVV